MRLIGPKERKLAHAKPSDAGASCLTARERENESRKKREGRALVSKGPWTRRVIILFQKQTTHTLRCSSSYSWSCYTPKGVAGRGSLVWWFVGLLKVYSIYTRSFWMWREKEKRDNKDEKVAGEETKQHNTHRCQKHNFAEKRASGTPFHQNKNLTTHTIRLLTLSHWRCLRSPTSLKIDVPFFYVWRLIAPFRTLSLLSFYETTFEKD